MNLATTDEVKQGKIVFVWLSQQGDERLIWDSSDPNQIMEAINKFDELIDKGYLAFLVDDQGNTTRQINKRNWEQLEVRQREEILFREPKEVRFVPPMVAG